MVQKTKHAIRFIFNQSIYQAIFANSLKEALVIPIFKGSDRSNPNNYPPISILPQHI